MAKYNGSSARAKKIGYDIYYSEQLTVTERTNYIKHLETQARINKKHGLETKTVTKKKRKNTRGVGRK